MWIFFMKKQQGRDRDIDKFGGQNEWWFREICKTRRNIKIVCGEEERKIVTESLGYVLMGCLITLIYNW